MKLNSEFYCREDVVELAKELVGCIIYTRFDKQLCGAIIAETEAYAGITDKASHAWGNRFTKRTSVMYRSGGHAYVYLCYGIHNLFNIVTATENTPHAILIRGAIPSTNHPIMMSRMGINDIRQLKLDGPGKFSKAMGIELSHNELPLSGNKIWIETNRKKDADYQIINTPRIGISYAEEDAELPYRFLIKNYWQL